MPHLNGTNSSNGSNGSIKVEYKDQTKPITLKEYSHSSVIIR